MSCEIVMWVDPVGYDALRAHKLSGIEKVVLVYWIEMSKT